MSTLATAFSLAAATLPATSPTTVPAPVGADVFIDPVSLGMVVLSVAALVYAVVGKQIHQPSKVAGPHRLERDKPLWPIWVSLGLVIFTVIVVSNVFAAAIMSFQREGGAQPAMNAAEFKFSETDEVIVSAVGPALGLIAALSLLVVLQPGMVRSLGFSWRSLPKGVRLGVAGALVAVPWTFAMGIVTEQVYRHTNFEHPIAHDLLLTMKSGSTGVEVLAIITAVLIAPVVEEFVFRGLLQTGLSEGLQRLLSPLLLNESKVQFLQLPRTGEIVRGDASVPLIEPSVANPAVTAPVSLRGEPVADGSILNYQRVRTVIPAISPGRRALGAWPAILITAALFALIHPLWTSPIIFVLAVILGYVYERTGNLWANITIHAMFNATSTFFFLFFSS